MKKIISFFIYNEVLVNLFIFLIVVFGLLSFTRLSSSFFPQIDTQFIVVEAEFPGASPEEVEEGITQKIEENLKGIKGIDRTTSTSAENLATIRIELLPNADENEVLQEVRNAVDRISSFPPDMERIVSYKEEILNFTAKLAVYGDIPLHALKEKAQEVEDQLRRLENISQIEATGFTDEEIEIAVRENNLRTYNLTIAEITEAVRRENIQVTGGIIRKKEENIIIRADNKFYEANQLRDIVIKADSTGRLVRLHQVADIESRFSEDTEAAYYNGDRAVIINVNSRNDENILEAAESIREFVRIFNLRNNSVKIAVVEDYTQTLQARIRLLEENGLLGALLVFLILGLFLKPRIAFWVALGIPVSFLGMFIMASFYGLTINVLSLFGMILVIGILVDDGVVIGENIYQHFEDGEKPFTAAINGTIEVMPSIVSAVLTTCVAFAFFFMIEGQLGEYFSDVSFVVIASLLTSLAEVSLFLPSHLAHSKDLKKSESTDQSKFGKFREKFSRLMLYGRDKAYIPLLNFIIRNKLFYILVVLSLLVFTFTAISTGFIRTAFFPVIEQNVINVTLEMTAGTDERITLENLQNIARKAEQLNDKYKSIPEQEGRVIENIEIQLGPGAAKGMVNIYLQESEERVVTSFEVVRDLREAVGAMTGIEKLSFETESPFGKPISISLFGDNFAELRSAKNELKHALAQMGELKDIIDNDIEDQPEVEISLLENANLLGLSLAEVITQVRNGFFGNEVQRLQKGDDEVKVWVRYDLQDRNELEDLKKMRIATPDGSYPLEQIARITTKKGLIAIQHLEGEREIQVQADIASPNTSAPDAIETIQTAIMPEILKRHPNVSISYEGQAREGRRLFSSITAVGPAVLLLMFGILVMTFRSFGQALVLLAVIPFGIIGAVWGHFIHSMPISLLSLLGFIALIGILFNDGLVFIHSFNDELRKGTSFSEAIRNTGKSRFRPLVLTTITTVAGLAPLIMEQSFQAQFLIPMAVTVAYGLLLGSFFVATLIPVFLILANSTKVYLKRIKTGKEVSREEVERAIIERRERRELE